MKTVTPTNTELQDLVELSELRYNELLNNSDITTLIDIISIEGRLENLAEHKLILESLVNDRLVYSKLVTFVIKHVITSSVKELPLTVLRNMTAELLHGRKASNRIRIASVVVKLLQNTGLFTTWEKKTSHGFNENIISCSFKLSETTKLDLKTKVRNLPLFMPASASISMSGHRKKVSADNSHMNALLEKLNYVGYTLDERVWNKYKYELAAYRFADLSTQDDMVAEGDKLLGKTFYFNHKFGPDNGRIYCDGDLFTLHGGALNYVYKFADKRVLTERGLANLRAKVQELEDEIETLSFKEKVEFYSLSLDLIDAEQGKPVGTILHIDAKLSGLQHQCIATRNKSEALYCGLLSELSDGYTHIRNKLSNKDELTRDNVKDAYNPYQYGAGAVATCKPVIEAGAHLSYSEWQEAYKTAFPGAFALRTFLLSLAKEYTQDVFSFTSPSGFRCTVTALGTEENAYNTCYGKTTYTRKEIDKKHMGVKIVAAFSHMMDASALHYVVGNSSFDMHVIHDSFGSHPNDTDTVHQLYIDALRRHLAMPVLLDFTSQIIGRDRAGVNVNRLIKNTLQPADIVAGLY